jgi:cobalt-zinc-cadmium efflux system membrane fusion protein
MKFQIIISLGLLVLGIGACTESTPAEMDATDPEDQVATASFSAEAAALAGIETGRIEKRIITSFIECTGQIDVPPQSRISVYSPVEGFVEYVRHIEGEYVKKGSSLTAISHPELIHRQRELLEHLSQIEFLEKDFERKRALSEKEAASSLALEEVTAALRLAQARIKSLRAELKLIGVNIKALEEDGEIQSSIHFYAPVSGYISRVEVNKGKLVTSQDLLFEIIDMGHLHLELELFAKDLHRVERGQEVVFQLPGGQEEKRARIEQKSFRIDSETKTAMVHAHLMEKGDYVPGAIVQARIFPEADSVWSVPEEAVIRAGNSAYIFIRKGEGYEKQAVRTGRSDGTFVELLDYPLEKDQEIVIKGAYYVDATQEEE